MDLSLNFLSQFEKIARKTSVVQADSKVTFHTITSY